MTKTEKLRALIARPGAVVAPCAYDALSARIIEFAGFELAGTTGFGMHGAMLGTPDNGQLAFNEMVEACGKMADATTIPIVCDAEGGYGNAINVMRTVREFEKNNLAGLFIEDQKLPPNCPMFKDTVLISIDEMCGKIRAAVATRTDPNFLIVARTDAPFEEAVERLNAYTEAGADMVKPIPKSRKEIEMYPSKLKAPIHLGLLGGKRLNDGITVKIAGEIGYKIVTFPMICLFANVKATLDILVELKKYDTDENSLAKLISVDDYFRLVGSDNYKELYQKFIS